MVEERTVSPGMEVVVAASHDTYGITFEICELLPAAARSAAAAGRSGGEGADAAAAACAPPPLCDPVWKDNFERMEAVHEHIARGAVQNPLDYRAYCGAAIAIAAQPERFGLDSDAVNVAARILH